MTAVDIGQAVGSLVIAAAAAVAAIRADRSSRRVESDIAGDGNGGSLMSQVYSINQRLGTVEKVVDTVDERLENVEARAVITADRVEAWSERQADHLAWHQAGQPERRTRSRSTKST